MRAPKESTEMYQDDQLIRRSRPPGSKATRAATGMSLAGEGASLRPALGGEAKIEPLRAAIKARLFRMSSLAIAERIAEEWL